MAQKMCNRGLQIVGGRASNTADAFAAISTMSVDDSTTAFAAGDTALNSGGGVTNEFDAAFDVTPTRSGQTVTHTMGVPGGSFNTFTVKRIALHNDTAANVTTSSATLCGGVDAQSFLKNSGTILKFLINVTYTST